MAAGSSILATAALQAHEVAEHDGQLGTVAGRYRLLEVLGRGGAAVAFGAEDMQHDGAVVALKRLLPKAEDTQAATATALFEREFHTLAQLSHPRVVEVYDYGVDQEGAFYTMELLDGSDAQSLAPLEFRAACALMRDICSALSLLHSRRFVHRDISPRNVRCTACGMAKLIDFGAMVPMGISPQIIGTPAFCAPEVLDSQPLDGRTDLYSLGATLYFLLSGRHVYPARDFGQLRRLWQQAPPTPSQVGASVPSTLDDLVMELIQLAPTARPPNAAVVMERLSAIAGLPLEEALIVPQAYLSTPSLVGRDRKLAGVRKRLASAHDGAGVALFVEADPGMGRTRFLEACTLEAKLLGSTVIQVSPPERRSEDYAAARALARQLLALHPEVARRQAQAHTDALKYLLAEQAELRSMPPGDAIACETYPSPERSVIQQEFIRWVVDVSQEAPLVLVADDVDEMDEPSAALLALLANTAGNCALAIVASAKNTTDLNAKGELALLARLSTRVALRRLSMAQAQELLGSIFGDASHLSSVAQRLHHVSGGNPRDLMQLTQHLVDRGIIVCRGGTWALPREIDASDLPDSMATALRVQIAGLRHRARELGQAFALTPDTAWTLEQVVALSQGDPSDALGALDELTAAGVLRAVDNGYILSQSGWTSPLLASLTPDERGAIHARLAECFAASGDVFRYGQHLLAAGRETAGLDVLVEHAVATKKVTDRDVEAWRRLQRDLPRNYDKTSRAALALCQKLGRPESRAYALRTRMVSVLTIRHQPCTDLVEAILDQCVRDAGLDLYDEALPTEQRVPKMLAAAQARHDALPEPERVLAPHDALGGLAGAFIDGLGHASNAFSLPRWKALPTLEPVLSLAPSLQCMEWIRIALGHRLVGRYGAAIAGYTKAIERFSEPDHAGLPDSYYHAILDGVVIARAFLHVALGSTAALTAVESLESGTAKLAVPGLRALHYLAQGNASEADLYRKEHELDRVRQDLPSTYDAGIVFTELCLLAWCDDLVRLRRLMPELERWVKVSATWLPMLQYAKGQQRRISGDFERSLEAIREGLSVVEPGRHQLWGMLAAAEVRCLVDLRQADEAVAVGRRHRKDALIGRLDLPAVVIDMPRSLALCAAGDKGGARELAKDVIASLAELESTGVLPALAQHNLARICLAEGDVAGFEEAAERCAPVFNHSTSQALASKYRRLMREARKIQRTTLQDIELVGDADWESGAAETYITTAFEGCVGAPQRAQVAAKLLARCCGSEKVFVYLPGADGCKLAATFGDHNPPPQLAGLVDGLIASESGDVEDATATGEGAAQGTATEGPLWQGASGERLHGVVLGHREHTGFFITGIAVIATGRDERFTDPGRVAVELSRLGMNAAPDAVRTLVATQESASDGPPASEGGPK